MRITRGADTIAMTQLLSISPRCLVGKPDAVIDPKVGTSADGLKHFLPLLCHLRPLSAA